jgi:hypothetical protein
MGKYSKPVSRRGNGFDRSCEQESLSMSDDTDCALSPAQKVPLGYNPSDSEKLEAQVSITAPLKDDTEDNPHETESVHPPSVLHDGPDQVSLAGPVDDGRTISSLKIYETTISWANATFQTIITAEDLSNIPDEVIPQWTEPQNQEQVSPHPSFSELDNDLNSLAALERAHYTAQPNIRTWACTICWENKDPSEFPTHPPTAACFHTTAECCSGCLTDSIAISAKTRYWNDIRCPTCDEHIEYEGMKEFAPKDVFLEYVFLGSFKSSTLTEA